MVITSIMPDGAAARGRKFDGGDDGTRKGAAAAAAAIAGAGRGGGASPLRACKID